MLEKLENWLASQKTDLILWLPVFLGLGSALYFGLKTEPDSLFLFGSWSLLGLITCLTYYFRERLKTGFVAFTFAFILFSIFSGTIFAKIKTDFVYTPMIVKDTRPVMVEGEISHVDILEGAKGISIILDHVKIENLPTHKTPKKIKLTSKLKVPMMAGQKIRTLVKLIPLSEPVMPDAYDFRRHYYFEQIGATGFMLKKPEIISHNETGSVSLFLEKTRSTMSRHIANVLPPRLSGISTALITGERAAIQKEDWNDLRISGLAHIISISGLHVVLIAGPVFFFIRFLLATIPYIALRWPIKKIAALVALLACTFYVALVVPTVPTYRSLVMTGVGLIAIMMDRSPFSLRLISFAAILVLIFSPENIWSASFQLSFAAVLSLIVGAQWTQAFWLKWRANTGTLGKLLIYLAGSVFTTLIISVVTAPLVAYHFQQIPIYSVVSNALSMPLTGLIIMPAVIGTFVLWPFGLQDHAIKFMGTGIEWLLAIAHETAIWDFSAILVPSIPLLSLILFSAAALLLILLKGKQKWASLLIVTASIIPIFLQQKPFVLISQTGNLLAVILNEKIYISSDRRETFVRETWTKRAGLPPDSLITFPKEGALNFSKGNIICAENVCRIDISGQKISQKISLGKDMYILKQDCDWANYIVTPSAFRDKTCKSRVFNKFNLMDTGAVEILENGTIKTVREQVGVRPWSPEIPKPFPKFSDKYGSSSTTRPESVPVQE